MRGRRLRSLPGGVVVSPSISLGLAKFNRAATRGSQAASGRCASIDAVSLLTMPQLTRNPLDWFLLQCAVRWLVRCGIFFCKDRKPSCIA